MECSASILNSLWKLRVLSLWKLRVLLLWMLRVFLPLIPSAAVVMKAAHQNITKRDELKQINRFGIQ